MFLSWIQKLFHRQSAASRRPVKRASRKGTPRLMLEALADRRQPGIEVRRHADVEPAVAKGAREPIAKDLMVFDDEQRLWVGGGIARFSKRCHDRRRHCRPPSSPPTARVCRPGL